MLEKEDFFDGRGHISLSAFLGGCEEAARLNGLLRDSAGRPLGRMNDLKGGIAVIEAVERFLSTPPIPIPVLEILSREGVEETLQQLIEYVSPLADRAGEFLKILADEKKHSKNRELAALYQVYREVCEELGVADQARVNEAILQLLGEPRQRWPGFLRQVRSIALTGVRWVGPFVDRVVRRLDQPPDPVQVTINHILEEHEQDWWGNNLMTGAGKLIFGVDDCNGAVREEYFEQSTREALDHLREGYAMSDPNLAGNARLHVAFSNSVGCYGEVEDICRRIIWETRQRETPIRPEDICIVARDIGRYADPIRSVFPRFGIPFYFRRGIPVLSSPVVKVLIRFLELSSFGTREAFCSLLESPWVDWTVLLGGSESAWKLADDIRRSGIEPEIDSEQELKNRLGAYFNRRSKKKKGGVSIRAVQNAWRVAKGVEKPGNLRDGITDLFRRMDEIFQIPAVHQQSADNSEGSTDERWSYLFNARAYAAVINVLKLLQNYFPFERKITWRGIRSLVIRALEELNIFPRPPDESGVWILSPYDIGGLKFKLVIIVDLTSGNFPRLPLESPIFSDYELESFHKQMGKDLPPSSLSTSRIRASQENLLFLTTLAAATENIVVSAANMDEQGRKITPSVYFSTLWRLAGWPVFKNDLPSLPPDLYDRHRLSSGVPYLEEHWKKQEAPGIHPGERTPFPGESFSGTVPFALSVTAAERRRAIVGNPSLTLESRENKTDSTVENIIQGIKVESLRSDFFRKLAEKEDEQVDVDYLPDEMRYCGLLGRKRLPETAYLKFPREFTTTELEQLIACPYAFYLQRIVKLREVETNDLEPSARDHGAAIHKILEMGFRFLLGEPDSVYTAYFKTIRENYTSLIRPAWAILNKGEWRLVRRLEKEEPLDRKRIPLACIEAENKSERERYLTFFTDLADIILDRAEEENWLLGVKDQLQIERQRIISAVHRIVSLYFLPPKYKGSIIREEGGILTRTTAFVEFLFGGSETTAIPPVSLTDPDVSGRMINVRGKIDRVDLIFVNNRLSALAVIDYKGSTKADMTSRALVREIIAGLDCQLPIYGLAARNYFGQSMPVIMQYLSYNSPKKKLEAGLNKHWIGLEKEPLTEEEWLKLYDDPKADLTEPLRRAIFRSIDRVESGEFLIVPAVCNQYCAFKNICRYLPGILASERTEVED